MVYLTKASLFAGVFPGTDVMATTYCGGLFDCRKKPLAIYTRK